MMETRIGLHELAVGESAVVESLHAVGDMRRRLLDIGLLEDRIITCVGRAPSGDPLALDICGAIIALRADDCRRISVRRLP